MSNQNQENAMIEKSPLDNPELYEFFAFVVDSDVAMVFPVHLSIEGIIAALQSNPKIVKLRPYEKNQVTLGWVMTNEDAPDNHVRFKPEGVQ